MIPLNSDDKEREVEDSFLSSQGCLVLPNRMIFWKSSKLDLTLTSPPDSTQIYSNFTWSASKLDLEAGEMLSQTLQSCNLKFVLHQPETIFYCLLFFIESQSMGPVNNIMDLNLWSVLTLVLDSAAPYRLGLKISSMFGRVTNCLQVP